MSPRLSAATLDRLLASIAQPTYDRARVKRGVVHFGPGAFFRAHQAAYFDRALATDSRWGVTAVSLHSPGVRDALMPQDGLYTLVELDAQVRMRAIGSLLEVLVAPDQRPAVAAALSDPEVRLVTGTVTEKGYCLGAGGRLDLGHPDIAHDLAAPDQPVSLVGWLALGMAARRASGLAPFAVLSCDNLADNGVKLKHAVVDFAAATNRADLAAWIETEAPFPRTMVDSITPATDDGLRAQVKAATGLDDAWPIQRETFVQWVVEDLPGLPGPDWRAIGVDLTADVRAFEQMKLRLLNGPHSTLAYVGLLAGLETVGEAMADAQIAGFVSRLMDEDILPTVAPPPGYDVARYAAEVRLRFANPAIRHTLAQIAWDGSQKLPVRLMATIADALKAGRPMERLAAPIAAWMQFVRLKTARGEAITDPLAGALAEIAAACDGGRDDVARFLARADIFDPAVAAEPAFRSAVERAYAVIEREGVRAAL